jgi:hypothetical protein
MLFFFFFFNFNEPNFIQTKKIQYKRRNKLAKTLTREFSNAMSEKEWCECSPRKTLTAAHTMIDTTIGSPKTPFKFQTSKQASENAMEV